MINARIPLTINRNNKKKEILYFKMEKSLKIIIF